LNLVSVVTSQGYVERLHNVLLQSAAQQYLLRIYPMSNRDLRSVWYRPALFNGS
jgi:hypothetical protein